VRVALLHVAARETPPELRRPGESARRETSAVALVDKGKGRGVVICGLERQDPTNHRRKRLSGNLVANRVNLRSEEEAPNVHHVEPATGFISCFLPLENMMLEKFGRLRAAVGVALSGVHRLQALEM